MIENDRGCFKRFNVMGILILLLVLAGRVHAGTYGVLTYEIQGETVAITDCDEAVSGSLVIPTNIEGKPVTDIGSWTFSYCRELVNIVLPNTLETIGNDAFRSCFHLANILIPDSVTTIGSSAFMFCNDLEFITVGEGNLYYTSIDGVLFDKGMLELIKYPAQKTGSYIIPNGVLTIPAYAFVACGGLVDIVLPNTLESIGQSAFERCERLSSVVIPAGVTSIGTRPFSSCSGLETITVDAGNPNYASLDGVLFDKNLKVLIQYPARKSGAYTIPEGVDTISASAFYYCHNLMDIVFPNSLMSIGSSAFYGCRGLAHIMLPAGVTSIGGSPFSSCDSLETITVDAENPNYASLDGVLFDKNLTKLIQCPTRKTGSYTVPGSVDTIGYSAFFGCKGLASIVLPDSLVSIESSVFSGCKGLSSVTFPNSLSSIGLMAFYGCEGLTHVTIPDGVTNIDDWAFLYCASLESITIGAGNPNYTSIDGVLFDKSMTTLMQCPGGKTGIYTLPDGVSTVGDRAFYTCNSLTSIIIPASVSSVGSYAFLWCWSLESITVDGGNLSYADIDGVLYNKAITELIQYPGGKSGAYTLPESITSMTRYAFWESRTQTSIEVEAGNLYFSSIDGVLFDQAITQLIHYPGGRPGTCTIPDSVMAISDPVIFAWASNLTSIVVGEGNPSYASVDGVLFDRDMTELITYPIDKPRTSYTVPDGVVTIADFGFRDSDHLVSIVFPESLIFIPAQPFDFCSSLTNVTFMGDAPTFVNWQAAPETESDFTIYYFNENNFFTSPTWKGYSSQAITDPVILWLNGYGYPIDAGMDQDLSGDGVALLTAYALDLDPRLDLSGSLPKPVIDLGLMGMRFYTGTVGIEYIVETSIDLKSWTASGVLISSPDAEKHRTAYVNLDSPCRFLRLRLVGQ